MCVCVCVCVLRVCCVCARALCYVRGRRTTVTARIFVDQVPKQNGTQMERVTVDPLHSSLTAPACDASLCPRGRWPTVRPAPPPRLPSRGRTRAGRCSARRRSVCVHAHVMCDMVPSAATPSPSPPRSPLALRFDGLERHERQPGVGHDAEQRGA